MVGRLGLDHHATYQISVGFAKTMFDSPTMILCIELNFRCATG